MSVPAIIVGVDECGYGSWAGPLVAAAVAYPATRTDRPAVAVRNRRIELCDSKRLKAEAIQALAEVVAAGCLCFERRTYTSSEVDFWGVEVAKLRLLRMVTARLLERLRHLHQVEGGIRIVVDGDTDLQPCDFIYEAIPQADNLVWQVSAASVIAKAHQLQAMAYLDAELPQYGFAQHAGYGTKQHREALQRYGVSAHHRRSFSPVRRFLPTPLGVEE